MLSRHLFLLAILTTVLLLSLLKVCHINIVTDRRDIITNDEENFSTDMRYKVIITNKSKSPIYFRGTPDLYSCGIYANEKIHYITETINDINDDGGDVIYRPHMRYFNIETKIDSNETKVFRVRGDVNNNNTLYEIDKEEGVTESQYPEFVTDVHFLFLFTRNPYTLESYTEYIEVMKNDGFAMLGYHNENEFYFTITDTEMKVNDDAINDLLFFVHSIREWSRTGDNHLNSGHARVTVTRIP
jgi:hypothetical protein